MLISHTQRPPKADLADLMAPPCHRPRDDDNDDDDSDDGINFFFEILVLRTYRRRSLNMWLEVCNNVLLK